MKDYVDVEPVDTQPEESWIESIAAGIAAIAVIIEIAVIAYMISVQ